jgi:hypothetical protein
MCNAGGLTTLGAFEHDVGDLDRHSLLDHASLPSLALRANMFFDNIEALNNNLADLWHRPRNHSFLPFVLASDNQNGITLFDIHLGKVERLFLFLLCCHF